MFTITMPNTFKPGDTLPVKINGKATTLTYRDSGNLVFGNGEVKQIAHAERESFGTTFMCVDADQKFTVYR
jgi:hypothetical protein